MPSKISNTEIAVVNKFDQYIDLHADEHKQLDDTIAGLIDAQNNNSKRLTRFENPLYTTLVDDSGHDTNCKSIILIGNLKIKHDKQFNRLQKWLISKLFNAKII